MSHLTYIPLDMNHICCRLGGTTCLFSICFRCAFFVAWWRICRAHPRLTNRFVVVTDASSPPTHNYACVFFVILVASSLPTRIWVRSLLASKLQVNPLLATRHVVCFHPSCKFTLNSQLGS